MMKRVRKIGISFLAFAVIGFCAAGQAGAAKRLTM